MCAKGRRTDARPRGGRRRERPGDDRRRQRPPRLGPEYKRRVGYEATATVEVESPLDRASPVAHVASSHDIRDLRGPSFSIADEQPVINGLLAASLEAASAKARLLAEAAGRELGRVISVSERGIEPLRWDGDVIVNRLSLGAADELAELPIAAADHEVSANLVVAFEFAD